MGMELRQIFGSGGLNIEKIYLPTSASNEVASDCKRAEILYQTSKYAKMAVKILNNLTVCNKTLRLKLASSDGKKSNVGSSNDQISKQHVNDGNDQAGSA